MFSEESAASQHQKTASSSRFADVFRQSKGKKKPQKLSEVESKLKQDYFSLVLMLQNRETSTADLANFNTDALAKQNGILDEDDEEEEDQVPVAPISIEEKIKLACDIFENSTSKEYLFTQERMMKEKSGLKMEGTLHRDGQRRNEFGLIDLSKSNYTRREKPRI